MTVKEIIFSKNQIETLARYSKENAPNESCAILLGSIENEQDLVKEIILTKNIENSPSNFTISNEELIRVYGEAEKKRLDVSGIFHSHTSSVAYPSSTDKKFMEINPIPWLIFSNLYNEFKAYIYDSGILPVLVKVV
jgi:proteasome lid subunit RPN8/RPN11